MSLEVKEYFDNLYDILLDLNLKFSILHEIVFSITAVKFGVRPAYFLQQAILTYHNKNVSRDKIYHILTKYDPNLYYYNYDKLGIIVSNTDLGHLSREEMFSKLGVILGFNYNIPDPDEYQRDKEYIADLSYYYTVDDKRIYFYTEVLWLEHYLEHKSKKEHPFIKQYEKFVSFGRLLNLDVRQEIDISMREEIVMDKYYLGKKLTELKHNSGIVENYYFNLGFTIIGDLIGKAIEESDDFFKTNEYIIGLVIYKLNDKLLKIEPDRIQNYLLEKVKSNKRINKITLIEIVKTVMEML